MPPIATENFPQVSADSPEALWNWLTLHHGQAESVWLVTFKAHVADKYLSTGQVLDALIAFGWIDGIRRKLDDDCTMQLIAPRQTQAWAKSYKDRATRLIREGLMQPSGLESIARGKASGLWTFMDDVDALIVPADLQAALNAHVPAAKHFAAFAPSTRRNILRWIKLAKTDATRARRIAHTAELAAENRKVAQM